MEKDIDMIWFNALRHIKSTFVVCVLLIGCGLCLAQSSIPIAQGELRLDGNVASYNVANGQLVLDANSFTLASGKSSAINPAKPKSILINAQTQFVDANGKTTAKSELKNSAHVAVIGSDGGSGKPLIARLVVMLDAPVAPAPAAADTSAGAPKLEASAVKMQPGEFLLNGQIKGIFSAQSIVIDVFKRTGSDGQVEELNPPVEQQLHLDAGTQIISLEDSPKTVSIGDIKLGQRVSLAGKYGGDDQPFNVRIMGVWKEAEINVQTYGGVSVLPETNKWLDQGDAAYQAGAYPEALQYFLKASQIAGGLGDTGGSALAQNELGLTYSAMNQPTLAVTAYTSSINFANGMGKYDVSAVAMVNLGEVYLDVHDAANALNSFDTALGWIDTNNFAKKDNLRLDALTGEARAQYLSKQLDKAIDTMNQAIALAQQLNDIPRQQSALTQLAFWQLDDQPDAAQDAARQAASLIPQLKDSAHQASAWTGLYLFYRLAKDDKNAQSAYDQATLLLTNLKDNDGLAKLEEMKDKLDKQAQEPQTPQ